MAFTTPCDAVTAPPYSQEHNDSEDESMPTEQTPCIHIPLSSSGETLESLYGMGTQQEKTEQILTSLATGSKCYSEVFRRSGLFAIFSYLARRCSP
jgi:hypothetical protein